MATLLNAVTEDTTGTGAELTGPCSVIVRGTLGDGTVHLEAADADSAGNYEPIGRDAQVKAPGWVTVDILGTYFLRARIVGSTSPSCTAVVIQ